MHVFKITASASAGPTYVLQRKECKIDDLDDVLAISYAWGSLPHNQAIRFSNELGIKLGKEWDFEAFVNELVMLSEGAWLWLDQLSLLQSTASTKELNISIPTVFQKGRVLVLLPGTDCEERRKFIEDATSEGPYDRRGYELSSVIAERLFYHAQYCTRKCIGGIDVWLRRVWPWQEFAYANRVRVRFAARARQSAKLPGDTLALLRQQVMDKDKRSPFLINLLLGDEVAFGQFRMPTGPAILRYISNYVEQNRLCTKDTDLVSAVAPAIGATVNAGESLIEGVKSLIDYIESATRTIYVGPLPCGIIAEDEITLPAHERTFESWVNFDAVGKISFLHGTHFADNDLLANVDNGITVNRFLPDPHNLRGDEVSEILATMSLSQRRMMVRWLSSWEPSSQQNDRGIFEEVFQVLKEQIRRDDVTSDINSKIYSRLRVTVNNPKQFMKLCLIMLRVIESESSDLGDKIVSTCELVKVENSLSFPVRTAIGYQRYGFISNSRLVALGDCALLVNPTDSGEYQVIGRVPFTNRSELDFRCCSSIRILNLGLKRAGPPLKFSPSRLPFPVSEALRSIIDNTVEFVDLSDGHVDDEAAIALGDALKQNTSVKTLFLQNNRIGTRGFAAIAQMMKVNKTLDSVHLPHRCDLGPRHEPHDDDCRLIRWRHEQQGNWHKIFWTDESGREPITCVTASNMPVGEEAILALAEVLKYRSISGLELTKTVISLRGVQALAKAIENSSSLQYVILDDNSLGDEQIRTLADVLQHDKTIEDVHIRENRISIVGARGLANTLMNNTVLQVLDLANNAIDDACAVVIASGLKHNQSLDTLSLRGNCIGSRGARAIASSLKDIALCTLDLGENKICDAGAIALAKALKFSPSLEKLDLSENGIGDDGALEFIDVLRATTTFRQLNLTGNRVGNILAKRLKELEDTNDCIDAINID